MMNGIRLLAAIFARRGPEEGLAHRQEMIKEAIRSCHNCGIWFETPKRPDCSICTAAVDQVIARS